MDRKHRGQAAGSGQEALSSRTAGANWFFTEYRQGLEMLLTNFEIVPGKSIRA